MEVHENNKGRLRVASGDKIEFRPKMALYVSQTVGVRVSEPEIFPLLDDYKRTGKQMRKPGPLLTCMNAIEYARKSSVAPAITSRVRTLSK